MILDFDFDRTIKSIDYTRRAVYNFYHVVDSEYFADMDSEAIFDYLVKKMEILQFSDYLKRYIYEVAELDMPFSDIEDEVYVDIIRSSFEANRAPFSFVPVTKKKTAIIKSWLKASVLKRQSIFILGFGLQMTDWEVTDFLTRGIKEEGFRFDDPIETIYWYCFHNQLPYYKALEYEQYYQVSDGKMMDENLVLNFQKDPSHYMISEKIFLEYLDHLKVNQSFDHGQQAAYEMFMALYDQCCAIIKESQEKEQHEAYMRKNVGAADVEKRLCAGIPVNEKGNLTRASASVLAVHFQKKRMSRQRLISLIDGVVPVERFDILTLLFYIYAETIEKDWPNERFLQYVDDANARLKRCGMMELYPVNPYESFILMCLLADEPMAVYGEIWEMSYNEDESLNEGLHRGLRLKSICYR